MGGTKVKRCYIVHITPRDVNSGILFIYRTGYTYGKEPEAFQKVFLSPFSTGYDSKVLEQNQFCQDSMQSYRQRRQTWYV